MKTPVFRSSGGLVVFGVMASGWAIVMAASLVALLSRKETVSLKDFVWAGSDVGAHPERYLRPSRVPLVRRLYLTGVIVFLLGVLVTVAHAVRAAVPAW